MSLNISEINQSRLACYFIKNIPDVKPRNPFPVNEYYKFSNLEKLKTPQKDVDNQENVITLDLLWRLYLITSDEFFNFGPLKSLCSDIDTMTFGQFWRKTKNPGDGFLLKMKDKIGLLYSYSALVISSIGNNALISLSTSTIIPPEWRIYLRNQNNAELSSKHPNFIDDLKFAILDLIRQEPQLREKAGYNVSWDIESLQREQYSLILNIFEKMFQKGLFEAKDISFVLEQLLKIRYEKFQYIMRTCINVISHCIVLINDYEIVRFKRQKFGEVKFKKLFIQRDDLCKKLAIVVLHFIISDESKKEECQIELLHNVWPTFFKIKDIVWKNIRCKLEFTESNSQTNVHELVYRLNECIRKLLSSEVTDIIGLDDALKNINKITNQCQATLQGLINLLVYLVYILKTKNLNQESEAVFQSIYCLADNPAGKKYIIAQLLCGSNILYLRKIINMSENEKILYFLGKVFSSREAVEVALEHPFFCNDVFDNLKKNMEEFRDTALEERTRDQVLSLIMSLRLIKNLIKFWQSTHNFYFKWQSIYLKTQILLVDFMVSQTLPFIHEKKNFFQNETCLYFGDLRKRLKNLKLIRSFSKLYDSHAEKNVRIMADDEIIRELHKVILQTFNYSTSDLYSMEVYNKISEALQQYPVKSLTDHFLLQEEVLHSFYIERVILEQNFFLFGYDRIVDPKFTDLLFSFERGRNSKELKKLQLHYEEKSRFFSEFTHLNAFKALKLSKKIRAFLFPHLKLRCCQEKFNFICKSSALKYMEELKKSIESTISPNLQSTNSNSSNIQQTQPAIFRSSSSSLKPFKTKASQSNHVKFPTFEEWKDKNILCDDSYYYMEEILYILGFMIPDNKQLSCYIKNKLKTTPNLHYFMHWFPSKLEINKKERTFIEEEYLKEKSEYIKNQGRIKKHHIIHRFNKENYDDGYQNLVKCVLGNDFCDKNQPIVSCEWDRLSIFNQILRIDSNLKYHIYKLVESKGERKDENKDEVKAKFWQTDYYVVSNCWQIYYKLNILIAQKIDQDSSWRKQVTYLSIMSNIFQNLCEDGFVPFKEYFGKYKVYPEYAVAYENLYTIERNWLKKILTDVGYSQTPFVQMLILYKYCNLKSLLTTVGKRIISCMTEMLNGPCKINQEYVQKGLEKMIQDRTKINTYFGEVSLSSLANVTNENIEKDKTISIIDNLISLFLAAIEGYQAGSNSNQINLNLWWEPRILVKLGIYLLEAYRNSLKNNLNQKLKHSKVWASFLKKTIKLDSLNTHSHKKPKKYFYNFSFWSKNCYLHPDHLIELYRNNSSQTRIFHVVTKIYQLILHVAEKNLVYGRFVKEKKKQAIVMMASGLDPSQFTDDEIHEVFFIAFCDKIVSSVEIYAGNRDLEEESLIKFYFTRSPTTYYLSEKTKEKFFDRVNIDTHESKILDLFTNAEAFHREMLAGRRRYQISPLLFRVFSPDLVTIFANYLFWDILVLNIIIIADFQWRDGNLGKEHDYLQVGHRGSIITILIVVCINIALSIIYLIGWLYTTIGLTEINLSDIVTTVKKKKIVKRYFCIKHETFENIKLFFRSTLFTMNTMVLIYVIISSIIFLATKMPIFIGIQLLIIIAFSGTVQYLVDSIASNLNQLVVTFVLGIFIVYCYALIVSQKYKNLIDSQDTLLGEDSSYCYDVFGCFLHIINVGTRESGVGAAMIYPGYNLGENAGNFVAIFLLQISFFILINIIIMNVVFGIILDTFAARRDLQKIRSKKFLTLTVIFNQLLLDDDRRTKCFICNLDKSEFQKEGKSFKNHIQNEHYVWNYVDLYVHLTESKEKNFSGVEVMIWKSILKHEYTFIPNGQALELAKESKNIPIETYFNRLERQVFNKLKKMKTSFKEIKKSVHSTIEKQEQLEKKLVEIQDIVVNKFDAIENLLKPSAPMEAEIESREN